MARKWIAKATAKHKGALRKALKIKKGAKIPAAKLAKAAHASGTMGRRARLAKTLRKLAKRRK